MSRPVEPLFEPFTFNGLTLPNRIVMAPMTRSKSPNGIPGADVAAYYRRRAEAETGLIITEGTTVNTPVASGDPNVPKFWGEDSLKGWKRVVEEVHGVGGKIMPQIWHMGMMRNPAKSTHPDLQSHGPSGLMMPGKQHSEPMTKEEIRQTVEAFGRAAADAREAGFDGVEVHGAHGYIIDQFFWDGTNLRNDEYGGAELVARSRFAVEIVEAIRREVGDDYPLIFRFSQWKQQDFSVKMAPTPDALAAFLKPLSDAGVDMFHCSQRRFWEPEFEGSDLNLAGWAKKLTGKPSMTVGSVSLSGEFIASFAGEASEATGIDDLIERLEAGEFDLVAVGRALLVDPAWARKVHTGAFDQLMPFKPEALATLS
ncbi:NADH:flavin oxidoreductase [Parvibaculum sp.]|jgi:2,4-dienoyl-CoA reductase-like NADH-dependent reductase (Old Yellow Enzyme family)|uniref:NADH:flavin oxidoreductase n=1 Tax=Parvibaculum sp. TaxID=2024848 RepID=UPI001B07C41F|nr:NADH:flavin oxidoreductase [Parvibaculum sp.]MBO6634936.1 NADH:flavin oxidoreductase [Parvibaculum sp.]MBO6679144.1 NADH:flavin oxidoreductase [Parvibaculum sp.]MBO6686396.1 NADH:flavin oxidoreductase [Parvibaculum sp.]MBO6904150.1 NADH:flavin oxidoreductase [Parvibaculum sp.]